MIALGTGGARTKRIMMAVRNRTGVLGMLLLLLIIGSAVLAPVLAPYEPGKVDLAARLSPPLATSDSGNRHVLGTDTIGRDVLSRILFGARVSLGVGALTVIVAAPVGTLLGMLSGYFGRSVDRVICVLIDIQLAVPFIILAIAILAVIGRSTVSVVLVIGFVNWVTYARVARGQVLAFKNDEFVVAARSIGVGHPGIIFRHILPNILSPLIVVATFQLAQAILLESSLSFLGAGVPPPAPTWGGMLSTGREYLVRAWWIAAFPGLALALTALGINFVGDWVRDELDPTLKL